MTKIETLLRSPLHVFTVQDLAVLWKIENRKKLWSIIRYYLRAKRLTKIHKGLYTTGEYTSFELAQKLITPSYISFYTALAAHGIVFQLYETIHSMALKSKNINIKEEKFSYHQLKEKVFYDSTNIEDKETYRIAGPERAVCDSLYLVPSLAFDNLKMINPQILIQTAKIYHNQKLIKTIKQIISNL